MVEAKIPPYSGSMYPIWDSTKAEYTDSLKANQPMCLGLKIAATPDLTLFIVFLTCSLNLRFSSKGFSENDAINIVAKFVEF